MSKGLKIATICGSIIASSIAHGIPGESKSQYHDSPSRIIKSGYKQDLPSEVMSVLTTNLVDSFISHRVFSGSKSDLATKAKLILENSLILLDVTESGVVIVTAIDKLSITRSPDLQEVATKNVQDLMNSHQVQAVQFVLATDSFLRVQKILNLQTSAVLTKDTAILNAEDQSKFGLAYASGDRTTKLYGAFRKENSPKGTDSWRDSWMGRVGGEVIDIDKDSTRVTGSYAFRLSGRLSISPVLGYEINGGEQNKDNGFYGGFQVQAHFGGDPD